MSILSHPGYSFISPSRPLLPASVRTVHISCDLIVDRILHTTGFSGRSHFVGYYVGADDNHHHEYSGIFILSSSGSSSESFFVVEIFHTHRCNFSLISRPPYRCGLEHEAVIVHLLCEWVIQYTIFVEHF